MAVVLLIRHAQASFDGPDYDVLSDLGHTQAVVLGRRLASFGRVDRVVTGGLRRQDETADSLMGSLGEGVERAVDRRWAEYDHEVIIAGLGEADIAAARAGAPADEPRRAFQAILDAALIRWCDGSDVAGETWTGFRDRVRGALDDIVAGLDRSAVVAVVTSGGVISALCADHLGLDAARWRGLNNVIVNTSVTKVVVGRQGRTLVSFNDHAHLEAAGSAMITYR